MWGSPGAFVRGRDGTSPASARLTDGSGLTSDSDRKGVSMAQEERLSLWTSCHEPWPWRTHRVPDVRPAHGRWQLYALLAMVLGAAAAGCSSPSPTPPSPTVHCGAKLTVSGTVADNLTIDPGSHIRLRVGQRLTTRNAPAADMGAVSFDAPTSTNPSVLCPTGDQSQSGFLAQTPGTAQVLAQIQTCSNCSHFPLFATVTVAP